MSEESRIKVKSTRLERYVISLRNIESFAKRYNPDQKHQVVDRLERLEKLFEQFEETRDELCDLAITKELETSIRLSGSEMEELFFQTKAILKQLVPEPSKKEEEVEEMSTQLKGIKLPTIKLPEFDGNYKTWLTFHDTFNSLIHSSDKINVIQKFHYLRASLKGEAASLIQAVAITTDGYDIAWKTLIERYSNKVLLKKRHVRALLQIPKVVQVSEEGLRSLVNDFQLHLQVLKQLGEVIDENSTILVEILSDKLDKTTLKAWEEAIAPEEQPTCAKMIEFIKRRASMYESLGINSQPLSALPIERKRATQERKVTANTASTSVAKCAFCGQSHKIYQCPQFNALSVGERRNIVLQKHLCFNCLNESHSIKKCPSRYGCKICAQRHNSLLHIGAQEGSSDVVQRATIATMNLSSTQTVKRPAFTNVFLSTVMLNVICQNGEKYPVRALLDSGSQISVISEQVCQHLRTTRRPVKAAIGGIGGTLSSARHEITAAIESKCGSFKTVLDFTVLSKVTHEIPSIPYTDLNWNIPTQLHLADPHYNTPGRIDMIIGAGLFYNLLKCGRFNIPHSNISLVETVFGWIVTGLATKGESSESPNASCNLIIVADIQQQLERFWRIEEVEGRTLLTSDEERCEQYYKETTTRNTHGRYIVKLPKHPDWDQMIGHSKSAAMRRFASLERKLEGNEQLRTQYNTFMEEYISLGHMSLATNDTDSTTNYFLPHHPVIKEASTTTKLRVVFDGSAVTTTGKSLNDALLVGPVVQDDLLSLVIRFRKFPVVLIADIEKMYRQVLVHPDDRSLQKILWRFNKDEPILSYELDTVTYGLAPSAYLATRTLLKLAEDEGEAFPLAAHAIKNQLYVDDLIAGADDVAGAIQLRDELNTLLEKGGFKFRKWCSNSLPVLEGLSPELLGTKSAKCFDTDETINTLGIRWEPQADTFGFSVCANIKAEPYTKRNILSAIAKLYDPLGLIAPVIVQAKILMQSLWVAASDWDEEIPDHLQRVWIEFCHKLPSILIFSIPRFAFILHFEQVELHCFADASEVAYGACLYVRTEDSNGKTSVCLLASKSRVSPLKPLTIPRLELCAALLAARLHDKAKKALSMPINGTFFWSDSTVTLQWLQSPPRTWKTFVANRVAEIQELTQTGKWQHVSGKDNPADLVSRGMSADEFVESDLWKSGPCWLKEPKSFWPQHITSTSNIAEDERKPCSVTLAAHTKEPNEVFQRFSSFSTLVRVIGFCLRFFNNCRNPHNKMTSKTLTVVELHQAKIALVKIVQSETFSEELQCLKKGNLVSRNSQLKLLSPFIDENEIIRVGGRLQQSGASYDIQHQIIIPGFHPFTQALLAHKHRKYMHLGVTGTLAVVRDEYWPINGKRAIRSVIRNCYRCCRSKPQPILQPEGQLPIGRVTPSSAFSSTGLDYCGPLLLKPYHRKAAARKCYICVFVCFSTKAVHFELVHDLSTPTFLMALDRFVYRRGKPLHIYSDNGTNFIGAKNELNAIYKMLHQEPESLRIASYLADEGIQWHLIPPRAPNFGGLWEAAVKAVKTQLVRQLGTALLTSEELNTVLIKIEGCLNSRPLLPLSEDPNDLACLTPAHFLLHEKLRVLPENQLNEIPMNRLTRYQLLQRYSQSLWTRWSQEYLKTLNISHRARKNEHRLKIGDIVIMKDDHSPAVEWPLARIIELHPGSDGVSRVATLRTKTGIMKRAVSKICPLECASEHLLKN